MWPGISSGLSPSASSGPSPMRSSTVCSSETPRTCQPANAGIAGPESVEKAFSPASSVARSPFAPRRRLITVVRMNSDCPNVGQCASCSFFA